MPLQLPNLDDRLYADLVEEARRLIPAYAPEWTNHNPTDPGITLVELFAFLSEMLLYRLNRVTATNVLSFLKLLNGTDWNPFTDEERKLSTSEKEAIATQLQHLSAEDLASLVAQQLPRTVLKLRRLERAVSIHDFETLALAADPRVGRVRCLPRINIAQDPQQERPAYMSLIILPRSPEEADLTGLLTSVRDFMTPRLLLTTQLQVFAAQFVTIRIKVTVFPLPDEEASGLRQRVVETVQHFLDPRTGAQDGQGWPFGRNVFVSELYSLLDQLPGVDYVTAITFPPPTPTERLLYNTVNEVIGIVVKPYELVEVQSTPGDVEVQQIL